MQIHNGELPRARQLARTGKELSRETRVRLQWMDFYRRSQNVARACRHFGISRQTFYRWQHRYDLSYPRTTFPPPSSPPPAHLVCRSGRSRPGFTPALSPLGQGQARGSATPAAPLGFHFHGGPHPDSDEAPRRLVEPPRSGVAGSRRPLHPRPYAIRKPKQYAVSRPGDLVQVDTLDVRPLPGVVFKQFTARDVLSRWDVIQAHTRATAATAAQFLDTLQHRMPFPIRALQVDGGSEFAAEFEQACQQRGLHLFVLPPRSPKLNGSVERAQRTHTEEFYQVTTCSLEMKKLNRELRQWEKIYNTVRPHQSLGYLTPQQFLLRGSSQRKE